MARYVKCKQCGEPWDKVSKFSFCNTCKIKSVEKYMDKTIAEMSYGPEQVRCNRHSKIRSLARRIALLHGKNSCEKCGYDDHVEIAHKKGIALFPTTAKMREVNSLDNLMALCPNHHWEYDHPKKESVSKNIRKAERPPYEQLMQEIRDTNYCAVGRKYGVSDNAIRRWVASYELDMRNS